MSGLWKDIIGSIKGSEYDFTKMRLSRSIILLAIPMVLEMIMESLFALFDIIFVSKLGAEATATVGITESLMTIIYAVGMGLGTATTSIVARRIGEHNEKKASRSAFQAIILGIFISIPFLFAGVFYSSDILRLMGASLDVQQSGSLYTGIMIGSNVIVILLFINNSIFRSAGDAMISMIVLITANLINIILDPLLIFGIGPFPELGVEGAAYATCIARGIGILIQFYFFVVKKRKIKINMESIGIDFKIIGRLLKLSVGGVGQLLISTTSWVALYRIMNEFGDETVAGYTIAIRIVIFSILPAWGLSNAASTLVGQNLGAKQIQRAERSVRVISVVNMAFLFFIGVVSFFGANIFIPLISQDINVIQAGVLCLKTLSFGYIFFALGMVMSQALNGAGDTFTPTLINFLCFWVIEIPLAYVLSLYTGMDEKGIFLAIVISESLLGIFAWFAFRRGKWKLREV